MNNNWTYKLPFFAGGCISLRTLSSGKSNTRLIMTIQYSNSFLGLTHRHVMVCFYLTGHIFLLFYCWYFKCILLMILYLYWDWLHLGTFLRWFNKSETKAMNYCVVLLSGKRDIMLQIEWPIYPRVQVIMNFLSFICFSFNIHITCIKAAAYWWS